MFPGFYLFDKYISSYVLTSLAGIFTACPLAIYHYKKRGGNDISMIFVFLFGGIGCMFGMHLLYGITNIRQWGSLLGGKLRRLARSRTAYLRRRGVLRRPHRRACRGIPFDTLSEARPGGGFGLRGTFHCAVSHVRTYRVLPRRLLLRRGVGAWRDLHEFPH